MQTLQTATVPQLLNSPFNYDRSWVHLSDMPKLCILTKACFEKSFIVSTNYPKSKNIHRTCLVVARHTTRIVPRLYLVVPFLKAAIIMQIIEKRPKKKTRAEILPNQRQQHRKMVSKVQQSGVHRTADAGQSQEENSTDLDTFIPIWIPGIQRPVGQSKQKAEEYRPQSELGVPGRGGVVATANITIADSHALCYASVIGNTSRV